ncbi:ADP-ribosyltransferase [Flavobacterium sp. N1718]|uniref:ADP-ribosyltransferase n=1 Tax=Flavobacterium sp. N1718 TaxID=2986822 RepID=UPI0022251BE3|nr:ADP-ribosyltransferase [Flavobacterium sp. N1718]
MPAYLLFYDKTKQYRKPVLSTTDNPDDFQVNDAYLAVELRAENMLDFAYLVQHVAGEKLAAQLKDRITARFVEKLQLETNVSSLEFLYRNIPEFAYEGLRNKLSSRTAFGHLISLKKYDESSWFIDSSNAVLSILRVIGNGKFLYQAFYSNPVLVKQLYENLDGTSVFEGTVTKNRMVFASLLWMLCANQRFEFDNRPIYTFFIGTEYELDSNVLSSSDAKKDAIFLRQFKRSASERTKYIPTGIGQPMEIKERPFEPVDDGAYFHPLTPVFLTDASGKEPITYKVPAIYVKTLSDEAEWKDIMTNVRIGVNVLSIVLSIASLGTATPALVTALALTDIAVSTFDIGVALAEDQLMQSDEGRAFLEGYNKVTLAIAGANALPLAGSLLTAGTRLLGRATVESTKNFLRASIARLVLEIEISGFVKNTLRFVEPTELFHSAEFLTRADKLWKAGVIFVEGVSSGTKGEKLIGALYGTEVIISGTKFEVMQELKSFLKFDGKALTDALEETYEFKALSTLLKDKEFKEIYDALKIGISRTYSSILTLGEESVLKYYTTKVGYKDLNSALRKQISVSEKFIAQEKLMNKALDKLPKFKSDDLLYRIEDLTDMEIDSYYKVGQNIENKHFTSSTYSEQAISEAMFFRKYTVLIRIEGKNGRLIEKLSSLPSEKEVLFKSKTTCLVKKIGYTIDLADPDNFMKYVKEIVLIEQ